MPVYEYECKKCGQVHEVWQSLKDAPLSECPECGGDVAKIISRSSFQLKGGGWYADGYSNCSAGGTCAAMPGSKEKTAKGDVKGCGCCG